MSKVKNLSKREASDPKKEYLFANIDIDLQTPAITIPGGSNIPYDNVLLSNCITLNSSGGAIVSSSGIYNISFLTHLFQDSNVNLYIFAIAVNGVIQDGTRSFTSDITQRGETVAIQHTNTVNLELNAGDIITIVNISPPVPTSIIIILSGKTLAESADTNLSIHKI